MVGCTKTILRSLLALCYYVQVTLQYTPPQAKVEALRPAGLRISVPHEDGMTLVAFHINVNEEFYGVEAGAIARDITKAKHGRWTYRDKTTLLNKGDVIHYWVHVDYRGEGYNLLDQQHVVTDLYDYEGHLVDKLSIDVRIDGCEASTTRLYSDNGMSSNPCAGDILLDENFRDSSRFNRSLWTIVEQFAAGPDYEFVVYRDTENNVVVKNGLKITPKLISEEFDDSFVRNGNLKLDRCTGRLRTSECQRQAQGWNILPPVSSGRLNTNKSLNFMYGRVEIRAKLPRGDWIYPLIILESVRNNNTQIRIASAAGNADLKTRQGQDISGHILWGGAVGLSSDPWEDLINEARSVKYNSDLWSKNFHVYELLWNPGNIVLKVDGEKYEEKDVELPEDTPFFLTIGLAVAGIREFPDYLTSKSYTKPWRNVEAKAQLFFYNKTDVWSSTWQNGATTLEVDYVKVWAL